MKPQLDPIPLHEMTKYEWWSSPHHSDWYYHTPREQFAIDIDVLAETLDPCLKPLALLLLENGIFTGPSCQGLHDDHGNEDKREEAFLSLSMDAGIIRTQGLMLKNVENGETFFFYDPTYRLPWSFSSFFKKAGTPNHGKVGYLPFYFEEVHEDIIALLESVVQNVPNAKITIHNDVGAIEVYGASYRAQCRTWKLLYERMVEYA